MTIMSHREKFFFVHVEKAAGMSMVKFLKRNTSDPLHFKDSRYRGPFQGNGGITAQQYIDQFGEDMWNKYYSFCFVRNPWDRLTSWYSYWRSDSPSKTSFSQWLFMFADKYHLDQANYFMSKEQKILVDFIGKYENLNNDFNIVCDHLGIKSKALPHLNQSKKRKSHYSEYYTPETVEYVRELCKKDIELFDYKFEDKRE